MGNIVLLDELTINKIAAGEVIERPASVVKELVENSIDAKASKVTIEVENGGIGKIRVIDNGTGLQKDDLEFAFERHATSKIREASDLESVKSMGFRGEALASIAAISNIEMISKTENDEIGNKIVVEGGKILEKEEVGAQTGTTITVSNLFFNTPVRYKFLKKDFTELGYIEDIVTKIALANPNVSIKLISTGKTLIQTSGNGDLKEAIYSIYGKDVSEGLIKTNYEYEGIKVTGFVGKPEIARGNRSHQLFFVNNRFIKDKTLSAAVEQAFKGYLTIGKYAVLVLNIEINPEKIDVNVHPTKLEIRWTEEQNVFKAVFHAIRESLLGGDLIRNPEKDYDFELKFKTNTEVKNEEPKFEQKEESSEPEAKVMSTKELLDKIEALKEEFGKDEEDDEKDENDEEHSIDEKNEEDNNEVKAEEQDKPEEEQKPLEDIAETSSEETSQQTQEIETIKDIKDSREERLEEKLEEKLQGFMGLFKKKEKEAGEVEISDEEKRENAIKELYNEKNGIDTFVTPTEEQVGKMADIISLQREMDERIEKLDDTPKKFDEMYVKAFGTMPVKEEDESKKAESASGLLKSENISVFEDGEKYEYVPNYKYIGALFNTYIVLEMKDEIYIIDQHAAHERVMYEKIKENYYSDEEKDSQIMLLPDIITLSHKEKSVITENLDMFEKAGFILEEFGDNTIRLIGVPAICLELDTKELFLEILDEIDTVAITAKQEKEDKFISTIACKAAIKGNMKITKEEVDSLMQELLVLPNPFSCPHGRPTAIKMTKSDLERKFDRRK